MDTNVEWMNFIVEWNDFRYVVEATQWYVGVNRIIPGVDPEEDSDPLFIEDASGDNYQFYYDLVKQRGPVELLEYLNERGLLSRVLI